MQQKDRIQRMVLYSCEERSPFIRIQQHVSPTQCWPSSKYVLLFLTVLLRAIRVSCSLIYLNASGWAKPGPIPKCHLFYSKRIGSNQSKTGKIFSEPTYRVAFEGETGGVETYSNQTNIDSGRVLPRYKFLVQNSWVLGFGRCIQSPHIHE